MCITFISYSCFITLGKHSSTILKKSAESRYLCLIPSFRENGLSFSPFSIMLSTGLMFIAFIMLRYCSSVPIYSGNFYHEGMLNFVKDIFWGVFVSTEMTMWVLSSILFMCYIILTDLHVLIHFCIPEMKPTYSQC
jgi:hypothetical protein